MAITRREGIFLAYSKADGVWRDLFTKQLSANFAGGVRFVDRYSIPDGDDSWDAITAAVDRSRCALLLLTENYLSLDHAARTRELPMLLSARERGLTLLPVLVKPCLWDTIDGLRDLQLVAWSGDTLRREGREVKRSVDEAGMECVNPEERESARERAVLEICRRVSAEFGIDSKVTDGQKADIPAQTVRAFAGRNELTMDREPIHSGEFAYVYRGQIGDEPVAVKVVPTAAWHNRVETCLGVATDAHDKLGGTPLVHVQQVINATDVHAVVMEYVPWPTLHHKLAERRAPLEPAVVALILARVARAQSVAHRRGVQLGALSPKGIFVDDDWTVRVSPIRIEAHLARGLALGSDHIMNWDVLELLTPEAYEGRQPISAREVDAHGQYYLGLLGLELLLGRRPVAITCFRDLVDMAAFFDDPRAHFEPEGARRWTEDCPALAFVLARLLARAPADRFESADRASDELRSIAKGRLPDLLRRRLEADYASMMCGGDFMARFYARLFAARPELAGKFDRPAADQSRHLEAAMRHFVDFHPDEPFSEFHDTVDQHLRKGITPDEVEAFRREFVAEVIATCAGSDARAHGDAWNAALRLGLGEMLERMKAVAAR
jgi:hemoglobin-like flavoprotein